MTDPIFTADHHGFYRLGEPFFPVDGSNITIIRLPAHLCDDLDWLQQIEQASQIVTSGKSILWEIDLGLSHFQFTPENSAAFFSYSLALEEFTAKIWPLFRDHTFGATLYRGVLPKSECFPYAHWETAFADWSADIKYPCYAIYCAQMLSEYLHRLISFLPDSLLPFAFLDVTDILSPAKTVQLLSKTRFEHLQLAVKGTKFPFSGLCWNDGQPVSIQTTPSPPLGIYLPDDSHIDPLFLEQLDQFIPTQNSFRIIPEEKLTEQWDGLDLLFIDPRIISPQGRRKLLGFIAAGGTIETLERVPLKFS